MKFLASLATLGAMASMATAYINPTDPWGETIWKPNTQVTITWTNDASLPALAADQVFDIYLTTGSDQQQVKLAPIATGVKAFTVSSVTYTVPTVSPPGKIYFLSFVQTAGATNPATNGLAWSTRFTITDTSGNTGTLDPTGSSGSNPGGNGTIVTATSTAVVTTVGSASSTGTSASTATATAAGAKANGAALLGASVLSVAAAVVVGAAALVL
ncbi:hypothetical protein EDD21DRAFT_391629 [Dissophora ornata]|nr:hypothetical protein BGZ58_003668 [Dissophora ornata]KAI8595255.1 hypothetical protein EDD21DRAFT_391629 [Dissophora ornata]